MKRAMDRRHAQGVTLIELIVVIVLLAILGMGFLSMYGAVTRRDAMASQIAPMTWLAQGAMEAVLAERPPARGTVTLTFAPYQVVTIVRRVVRNATTAQYQATVTVSCVNGSCQPIVLKDYAYAIQ
jgi:prepilin-type N-terminal cleavage/methylation domain-containing protein